MMSGGCLEGVLEVVRRVSGRCLEGVWKVSRGCVEAVWRVSGRYPEDI